MKKLLYRFAVLTLVVAILLPGGAHSLSVSELSPTSGPLTGGTPVEFKAEINPRFVQLEGGDGFSVGLTADGKVYSWGRNTYGELGDGTTANKLVPTSVVDSGVLEGKVIKQISTGGVHTLALDEQGRVYSWGNGNFGQIGNGQSGSGTNISIPVSVSDDTILSSKVIVKVEAGHYYSLALASDGTVYGWGRNNYGQLGNGSTVNSSLPVELDMSGGLSGKQIKDISAAELHAIALTTDGVIYSWGDNWNGQLGVGTSGAGTQSLIPVQVTSTFNGESIRSLATGWQHSMVLTSNGEIWAWGGNYSSQLGDGTSTNRPIPYKIAGLLSGVTVKSIAAGAEFSIALTASNEIYQWGSDSTMGYYAAPEVYNHNLSETINNIVIGAWSHFLATTDSGAQYAWGWNYNGHLGDGTTTDAVIPTAIDMSNVESPLPTIYFGTQKASALDKVDVNRYRAIAPAGVLGVTDITVEVPGEEPVVLTDAYTYINDEADSAEAAESTSDGYSGSGTDEYLAETGLNTWLYGLTGATLIFVSIYISGTTKHRAVFRK